MTIDFQEGKAKHDEANLTIAEYRALHPELNNEKTPEQWIEEHNKRFGEIDPELGRLAREQSEIMPRALSAKLIRCFEDAGVAESRTLEEELEYRTGLSLLKTYDE